MLPGQFAATAPAEGCQREHARGQQHRQQAQPPLQDEDGGRADHGGDRGGDRVWHGDGDGGADLVHVVAEQRQQLALALAREEAERQPQQMVVDGDGDASGHRLTEPRADHLGRRAGHGVEHEHRQQQRHLGEQRGRARHGQAMVDHVPQDERGRGEGQGTDQVQRYDRENTAALVIEEPDAAGGRRACGEPGEHGSGEPRDEGWPDWGLRARAWWDEVRRPGWAIRWGWAVPRGGSSGHASPFSQARTGRFPRPVLRYLRRPRISMMDV